MNIRKLIRPVTPKQEALAVIAYVLGPDGVIVEHRDGTPENVEAIEKAIGLHKGAENGGVA